MGQAMKAELRSYLSPLSYVHFMANPTQPSRDPQTEPFEKYRLQAFSTLGSLLQDNNNATPTDATTKNDKCSTLIGRRTEAQGWGRCSITW